MNLSAESQRELERLMALGDDHAANEALPDSKGADRLRIRSREALRDALSALLDKLARTEAEVDRLDGIRGELTDDHNSDSAVIVGLVAQLDEARRLAERMRDMIETPTRPLPWELGAPAAGREEGK